MFYRKFLLFTIHFRFKQANNFSYNTHMNELKLFELELIQIATTYYLGVGGVVPNFLPLYQKICTALLKSKSFNIRNRII